MLKNRQKWYIPNEQIFNAHRYDWGKVVTVPVAERDGYGVAGSLTSPAPGYPYLIQVSGNPTIYLIENGKKRPIFSGTAFESWGFKWGEIKIVSSDVANSYPTGEMLVYRDGTLIKNTSGSAVYAVEQGVLRPIESGQVFETMGYDWGNVVIVPDKELSAASLKSLLGIGEMITMDVIKAPPSSDTVQPWFNLANPPTSGETLIVGQEREIKWNVNDNQAGNIFIDLFYTLDGWHTSIKTNLSKIINTVHSSTTDSYTWTPETASDQAGIRIVGYDEAGNVGYYSRCQYYLC